MKTKRWLALGGLLLVAGCLRPLPPPTDNAYLKQLLNTNQPVLLDCWATWCVPCRQMSPVIDQLASEYRGRVVVAKLNVDQQREVARHLDVSSIPALMFFKDGKLVERMVGVQPKAKVAAVLDQLLKS
jgi:thioredoxin